MMAAPAETVSQRLARETRERRARIVTPKGREYIARTNAPVVAAPKPAPVATMPAVLPETIGGMPIGKAVETASRAVEAAIPEGWRPPIPLIQRVVCEHFGISRERVLSDSRMAPVVRPRQVAMYLAKTMTFRSLPEIGRRFGGRDHTTVLHAVRKLDLACASDSETAALIEGLREKVKAAFVKSCAELKINKTKGTEDGTGSSAAAL